MPIDIDRVVGADLPQASASWSADDVILYHLGLGAGMPPTDPGELAYTYEGALKVLPSFGVIPAVPLLSEMLRLPGMDVDLAMILHGEQDLEMHASIPVEGVVQTSARVSDVFDKGNAALVILETVTSSADDSRPLFTNRFSAFVRGEGGFGGESGASSSNKPPEREPDTVVERSTLPNQALLYRLSGDKNPIHADPEFAKRGGFDQPILHGLCSYGIVCKAVVDEALEGDVERVARYQARFAGVVFPGETLVIRMWREDGRVLVEAGTKERDSAVISNAAITLHRPS